MNPPDLEPSPYGPEVAALARIAGVDEDTAALTAAAVVGALAGPNGGLITLGGELQQANFHLVAATQDSARSERLLDLLTKPAAFVQNSLRNHSQTAQPKLVREMAAKFQFPTLAFSSHPGDPHDYQRRESEHLERMTAWNSMQQIAGMSGSCNGLRDPWVNLKSGRRVDPNEMFNRKEPELTAEDERHLREPSFLLTNPIPDTLQKCLAEADQQHLLGLDCDGRLLEGLLAGRRSKSGDLLQQLLAGTDLPVTSGSGFGSLSHASLTVISILRPDALTALGKQTTGPSLGLPSGTLMIGSPSICTTGSIDPEEHKTLSAHYEHYRQAITRVLMERRLRGSFTDLALDSEETDALFAGQADFIAQLESIDAKFKPWSRGLAHLPAALLFGLKALTPPGEKRALVGVSLGLAHRAMKSHLALLEEALHCHDQNALSDQKEVVLQKLRLFAPCHPRELVRRYPQQRMALHRPIIDALISDRKIEQTSEGLLQLVSATSEL